MNVFVSGDKAGAGGYNPVGHIDLATSVQTAVAYIDSDPASILTQWTTSVVCVAGQNVVTVHSTTDTRRHQQWSVFDRIELFYQGVYNS